MAEDVRSGPRYVSSMRMIVAPFSYEIASKIFRTWGGHTREATTTMQGTRVEQDAAYSHHPAEIKTP